MPKRTKKAKKRLMTTTAAPNASQPGPTFAEFVAQAEALGTSPSSTARDAVCALASELAYRPYWPLPDDERFVSFGPAGKGAFQGFVFSLDDLTIVAFRGTEFPTDINDLLHDLRAAPRPFPAGAPPGYQAMAPQGFVEAVTSSSADKLLARLEQLAPSRLWLTGHSLGGALAQLFAFRKRPQEVVTFASPCVAKSGLAQVWALPTWSFPISAYAHVSDIVPLHPNEHIPPYLASSYRQLQPPHMFGSATNALAAHSMRDTYLPYVDRW